MNEWRLVNGTSTERWNNQTDLYMTVRRAWSVVGLEHQQSALRFSRLLGAKERQFSIRETDMSSAQWLKNRLIRKWQATNKPTGWGGVLTGSWIRRVRNDWLYWSAVITGQNNKFNLKVLHRSHLTNTAKWAGDTNAWQKWKVHNFPCRLESSGPQIPGFWFPFSSKLF